MTEKYIILSMEKAKPLQEMYSDESFKTKITELKNFLNEKGLNDGILRVQLFCENEEDKKETLSAIEYTDKGSMLYYTEWF